MKKILITTGLVLSVPMIANAQGATATLYDIFDFIRQAINLAIPLLIAAAVVVLLWGILQLILKPGADEETQKKAKATVLTGIIGIFVMVSIWGLVNILVNTFNLSSSAPEQHIEDLVDLPFGDFGDDLSGSERCASNDRYFHTRNNSCDSVSCRSDERNGGTRTITNNQGERMTITVCYPRN